MMRKKTIAAAVIMLCMLFPVLTGCINVKDTTIPLDVDMDNKPTLNIHLQAAGITDEQLNAEPTAALLEQLTGYKVKYSQLSAAEENSSIDYIFEGKTKYHAIKVSKVQYNSLLAKGYLLNIKPALEKYGTDIYGTDGTDGDISDYSWSVVSKNGGIYGIPEGGPPTPGQVNVEKTIFFRKDQLMDEGFNVPTTRDEFKAVLVHFKNKYGAGNPSYRPFTFTQTDSLIAPIAVSFGIYQEWMKVGNEYKFYFELPQYKDYMEYMISLANEGLVDLDAPTNDKSQSIAKFASGQAVAIAAGVWDSNVIQSSLYSNGHAAKDEVNITALKALLDPNGQIKTFHGGGYPYITVIPKYMNDEAAYTVDHLNKKIEQDNFKQLVIGTEGVHHFRTSKGYVPVSKEAFKEKDFAAFFCTGINEKYYPDYFMCRIEGQTVKEFFIELNVDSDTQGTYNPLNFTPYLDYYDSVKITLEESMATRAMSMMFVNKSVSSYDTNLNYWKNSGGTKGTQELNKWIKDSGWNY